MISKILTFAALIGAAMASPIWRQITTSGQLASGAGFSNFGTTTAGAASDSESGIASAGIDGIGSVLGLAGPNFAAGAALASPSL